MDLSLNFAADEPSASSLSRQTVKAAKGGRWIDRMKASQQARKQVKSAASTSSSRKKSGSTGSKEVRKETNNQTTRQSGQDQAELPVKKLQTDSKKSGKLRERTTNDPVSHQDHDAAPVTAGPAAKRQVISSLFSNLQKVTPSESSQRHDVSASTTFLTPSNAPSLADSFADMDIPPEIVSHLTGKMSLSHPTTIQKLAVPFLCNPESSKKDALLQAQTGSGKTLAYLIPIIQDLCRLSEHFAKLGKPIERNVGTMAIILVPTRELANQIFEVASKLLGFSSQAKASHRWITPGLLTGGAHRQHEKARLRKGVPLLIATPGRLLDHLETTKAFRIAGESIRHSADVPRPKRKIEAQDSDEEFAYEDQETSHIAGDAEDGYISSDEDFESMARSRSHRTAAAAAARQSSKIVPPEDPLLALRWLVLDEADRLMDMGFEPQIGSIVQLLETRLDIRKAKAVKAANRGAVAHRLNGKAPEQAQIAGRRTILCSATVEENVQKLAGIALREPLLIKGDDRGDSAASAGTSATKYAPPSQLTQKYAIVPPKLRFVTLVALLRQTLLGPASKGMKQKVLVFMSCTDAVDFAWTALGGLKMGRTEAGDASKSEKESKDADSLAGKSSLLPGTPIYRLHGSLDLRTRLSSLKNFASSAADCSVLLCTSVAGRGLDVENVSCVIQYDLPTEGGVNEYIHRVGRTARAGTAGQAWAFLMPNEIGWVDWAKAGMTQLTEPAQHGVSLQETEVSDMLRAGFGGGRDTLDYETRATDVQMAYERWVVSDEANTRLAKKAFASHIRAYATHPSEEKQFFHVKSLHLGHLAKAFGLREAPAGIGGGGGASKQSSEPERQQTVGRKKRKAEELVESAPPVDNNVNKRPAIPRSGRALDGKGLRGPKATVRDDFNIASTDALASMLVSKRKK